MDKIELTPLQGELDAEVFIPGSKSYTNRAFVMAALADGESEIIDPLFSDDTKYMIEALRNIGVEINLEGNRVFIKGTGGKFSIRNNELFCGIAGTTSRFMTAFAAIIGEEILVNGEGKILERPIGELVEGLKQLGVEVDYTGKDGSLPLRINGNNINGNIVGMRGDVSSQYFTALLLIAPLLKDGLIINVEGEQISKSYIDMTISGMKDFGVEVINDNYKKYTVKSGQKYKTRKYKVEGDWSTASYFCAIGAIHKGRIIIRNLENDSVQGDRQFPEFMKEMGAKVEYISDGLIIHGGQKLKGISKNMEMMPDTAMTLAAVSTFAEGETKITGLSTLKVKETNRLEAKKNELNKIGIVSQTTNDSISILGGSPKGAEIETYHDHRIAMSMALVGTKVVGIIIKDPKVVGKSFPEYWDVLAKIGIKNI